MLFEITVVLTVSYAALILLFVAAALSSRYSSNPAFRPKVSIIIAARDEQENIGACLDSLLRLTYPRELLEIIIVDDRSSDLTGDIVARYAQRQQHIRLIRSVPESGHLRGKTNAVTQGIDVSVGEILLFTDADCRVPAGWVESTVRYYTDGGVGTVAGFTSLRGTDWFSRMQALDWMVLFSAAAATARVGYPTTAVGTNLSVRRRAYDATGGYREIPFSVTEDYALFHAITAKGYRAKIPMDNTALVESTPCGTWKQLYSQKKRWFTGGRGMDVKSLLVFAIPYVFNLLLLVAPFILPGPYAWIVFGVKLVVDFLFCLPASLRLRRPELILVWPLYELYYFVYVLVYPPIVLIGSEVVWKERTFRE